MVKKSKFKLSDEISKYLPEIESTLSISDLLNHNSKLPTIQSIQEDNPMLEYSTLEYANLAVSVQNQAERSDLNYNILGLLIEKISGQSFQQNIYEYSEDLNLKNTYFKKTDPELAVGYLYSYQDDKLELQIAPSSNLAITFSSNGIKSTADDLMKIIRSMSENKIEIDGYLKNDGYSYSLINIPQDQVAIIILSNRRHPIAKEISNSIQSILNSEKYRLPLARKRVEVNRRLLKEYSGSYSLNENMILEIINKRDSLFLMMGPNSVHLIPQSKSQFFMEGSDASIRFLRDENDRVNEAVLLDGFLDGNKINRIKD